MDALIGVGFLVGIPYLIFAAAEICRMQILKAYIQLQTLI